MKIYMLIMETNPHIPNSGGERLVALNDDRTVIDNIYNNFPNMHFVSGYDKPATILRIKELECPYHDEWLIDILSNRRDKE